MKNTWYVLEVYISLAFIVGVLVLTCYMAPAMFISEKTIERAISSDRK